MHDTWKSKKLWFSVGVIATALVYAILSATFIPNLGSYYDSFTGTLQFITGVYLTGNVANKLVIAKSNPGKITPKAPPGGPKVPDDED